MTPTQSCNPENAVVVLGVTGSIAAYKAADLTSKLVQKGHDVHVIMTGGATELVQPRTFLTLSRNPVTTDLWDVPAWQPEHVALAERADLLVVAPATANFLGKYAAGVADDALTTYALTHTGSVAVAPAMNPRMWQHPAVRANVRTLEERGVRLIPPAEGRVACGEGGAGRMADVEVLLRTIAGMLSRPAREASGQPRRILVTAGPTCEDIDPVRFLSNRSSGRMGYALARAAAEAGCEVTLVTGPTCLAPPAACRVRSVRTAADMAAAVLEEFPHADALLMAAAVADFRPAGVSESKIHKTNAPPVLNLSKTADILAEVASIRRRGQRVLGFAAETDDILASAREKLRRKELDWIAANKVGEDGIGFGADENEVTVIGADGQEQRLSKQAKSEIARTLVALVLESFDT